MVTDTLVDFTDKTETEIKTETAEIQAKPVTTRGQSKIQLITPPDSSAKKPSPIKATQNSEFIPRTPTQPTQLRGQGQRRGQVPGVRGQRGNLRGQPPVRGRGQMRGNEPGMRGRGEQLIGQTGTRGRGQVSGIRGQGGQFRGNVTAFRGRGQPIQPRGQGTMNRGRGVYSSQQREKFFAASAQQGHTDHMNENMGQDVSSEQITSQVNTVSQGNVQLPQNSQTAKTVKSLKKVTKKILIVKNSKGEVIRRQAIDKDTTQEQIMEQVGGGKLKTHVKTTTPLSRQVSLQQIAGETENIIRTVLSGQPSSEEQQGARTVVARRGSGQQETGRVRHSFH